jgi:hypothetical protein
MMTYISEPKEQPGIGDLGYQCHMQNTSYHFSWIYTSLVSYSET